MNRREFLYAFACAALAAPPAAEAQQAGKPYRVGLLGSAAASASPHLLQAFRQGLRDLGWVEDRDIVIEDRWAEGRLDRLTDLAADLVRLGVDVIVSEGTPGSHAAKHVTRTIAIVMVAAGDPVATGLVASLTRPGGNVTGLSTMAPELGAKQLQLLRETVPRLSRVGVLWNSHSLYPRLVMREAERAAGGLGVQLESLELRVPEDLDRAFENAILRQVDALMTVEDSLTVTHRARIVDFAAKSRLAAVYGSREFLEAGGLMMYGADLVALFRRSAIYVERILKGAKPGDLPVERPTTFELIVNLRSAKALGFTISPALVRRADHVIEP
ncbi:MAG TPA: ABC transporter substrate-binding protein [Candidatus Limnocylindria bacterium]|nr:ABC transporter substrate-binding protein [Candidatus Limnocylindria bacterium]